MENRSFTGPGLVKVVLILQFIPLVLFPLETFSGGSQEWWLPAMLVVLALVAALQVILRGSQASWPWKLFSFSQGLNIISRLLLLWPHAAVLSGGVTSLNAPYLALTILSIVLSGALLWYFEIPEVRMGLSTD